MTSKLGSYFTNALGGDKSSGRLGRSTLDRLVTTGINKSYGGMQKFAQSQFIKNKMPMLTPALTDAASTLKNRLSQGYSEMMGGGGGGGAEKMQGIERV